MPRALIACDKFKGSLSAIDACRAIARGLGDDWQCDLCPIADGGEGFTETMVTAANGSWIECAAHDALERPITARYGIISQNQKSIAIMEMAAAAGYWRINPDERDIMQSHTYGVGEMLAHAATTIGVDSILIGIGGSATNDAGAGMARALGVKFLDVHGNTIAAKPNNLTEIVRIDHSQQISLPPIRVACDVSNPLCGSQGASHIYGPQKGATPEMVTMLDRSLLHLADLTNQPDLACIPGAGAAGGLGFGLMAFANAELASGFTLVAEVLDMKSRIAQADVVITGEGSLDEQSLNGKGPVGIAEMAKKLHKPCLAFAGCISAQDALKPHFHYLADIMSLGNDVQTSMNEAAVLLEELVRKWVKERPNDHVVRGLDGRSC